MFRNRKLSTIVQELLRYTALATPKFFRGRIFIMPANEVETAPVPATADFKSLEEKVLRTIELLKSAREAKAAAERDAARLREQLNQREEEVDALRQELVGLRREREEVRTRVEKMLGQIEALTAEESA
jgi:septal ring factor EnvC (AmiA/AmiB activator)